MKPATRLHILIDTVGEYQRRTFTDASRKIAKYLAPKYAGKYTVECLHKSNNREGIATTLIVSVQCFQRHDTHKSALGLLLTAS